MRRKSVLTSALLVVASGAALVATAFTPSTTHWYGTTATKAASGQLGRAQLDAAMNPTLGGTARAACTTAKGQVAWFEMSNIPHTCAFGLTLVTWGAQGPKGDTGATGATGATGPSGVQAIATHDFGGSAGVVTGGSFVTLSTEVGTYDLDAGTYEACLSGQVEQPTAATGSVSAQLFLYDQAKSPAFTGDLMNLSADPQAGTKHDAYMNGCTLITEANPVTLHLYAFGYDSDQGAGSYNLIDASLKLIQLTPAA